MRQKVLFLLSPNDIIIDMKTWNIPPMAIGNMQGYLRKQGYHVKSYDLNAEFNKKINKKIRDSWIALYDKDFLFRNLQAVDYYEIEALFENLLDNISINEYDIVGISTGANTSVFEIHAAFLLGKLIELKHNKIVVFGGTNISYLLMFKDIYHDLWMELLDNFKYIITGPGEKSFVHLLSALEKGEAETEYQNIKGSIYLENGEITSNLVNQAELICPDFNDFELDYYSTCLKKTDKQLNEMSSFKFPYPFPILQSNLNRKTLDPGKKEERVFIPYIFNYHCLFRCAFCEESAEHKNKPLSSDALTVFNDLKELSEKYNTKYFHFFNNMFNYKISFVKELCNLIIDNKLEIYWDDCARVKPMTKEMLELMYRAGCRKLVIGLESVSTKILKLIDKRMDLEQTEKVLEWCHEIGIWVDLEIIIGFPYENDEDIQMTIDFINRKKKYVNHFQLNRYFVLPDSLFGRKPENYGIEIILKENYDQVLSRNKAGFFNNYLVRMTSNDNMTLKSFNEVNEDGRPSSQIITETEAKFIKMATLLNSLPVYKKDMYHLNLLCKLKKM